MENPVISLIVAVYNVEPYLDRCMESLLGQTFQELEIILVDDGSLDESGRKCDAYAKDNPRVRVIHKENAGLGMARNTGIEAAAGRYVGFVDSDDYISLTMYEELYRRLEAEQADTCFCRYYDVDSNGKKRIARETFSRSCYEGETIRELLLGMTGSEPDRDSDVDISISSCRGLYSMELIKEHQIRFYSEREYISEDLFFNLDYLRWAKRVSVISEGHYFYCSNGNSLTRRYRKDRFEMEKVFFLKEREILQELFPDGQFEQRLYKAFMGRVRRCILQEVAGNPDKGQIQKNIRRICGDLLVQEVLTHYEYRRNNGKQRLVNGLIRQKKAGMLRFLFGFCR